MWFDGAKLAELDMYSAVRGTPASYVIENVAPGPHTLRFEVLSKRNSNSKGNYINLSNVLLIPAPGSRNWLLR